MIVSMFAAGYTCGSWKLGALPAIVAGLLYFYSLRYKRLFLWGNLVIALVSGFSLLIVWLFEFFSLQQDALSFAGKFTRFHLVNSILGFYALMAFLLTLAREIAKDVEDIPGDSHYDCKTLAIRQGPESSLRWVNLIIRLVLGLLLSAQFVFLKDYSYLIFWFSIICIDLPLIWLLVRTNQIPSEKKAAYVQQFLRAIMIPGICSMLLFRF